MKLRRNGLVRSVRGPGGGYVLGRDAEAISIGEVMAAVDEPVRMTRCVTDGDGCVASQALHHALPMGRAWRSYRAFSGYGHVGRCFAWPLLGAGAELLVERARRRRQRLLMSNRSYLDHNATAPLRPEARDAMIAALDCMGNPSSIHAEGRAARAIVENARETVARVFGVKPAAVTFTSERDGSGELAFAASRGSEARRFGGRTSLRVEGHRFPNEDVHVMPVSPQGVVELEALEQCLAPRAIVAVQAANNETGVDPAHCGNRRACESAKGAHLRLRCRAGRGPHSSSRSRRGGCAVLLRPQVRRPEGRGRCHLATRRAARRSL